MYSHCAITVLGGNGLSGIAPTGDMIDRPSQFEPEWTRYDGGVWTSGCLIARLLLAFQAQRTGHCREVLASECLIGGYIEVR
jgi:hypothetical protein